MDSVSQLFLQAVKAALQQEKVSWTQEMQPQDWIEVFRLADTHHVLPMVYEAVYDCPAAQKIDKSLFTPFKKRTLQAVMLQAMKTSEFLRLYQHIRNAGVDPILVKGILVRELYPNPDCRMSGDEDLLIPPEQFPLCHQAMLAYGMVLSEPDMDIHAAYEVPYGKRNSPIYIELHKSLFPPESEAYGELNRLFARVQDTAIKVPVQGVPILSMNHTDHLLYLLCHSFKHFLHSGFGIRQVCDIVLYANAYGSQIDWLRMLEQCKAIHAEQFASALFRIGSRYLTFDPVKACYPKQWQEIQVDELPMLEDLLDSGVYGSANRSRLHSSTITLNAVSAQKKGKKAGNHLFKTIFPSAKELSGRYRYLERKPFLLPVAWMDRILHYRKETAKTQGNTAAESIKIGTQRIELMKQYGVIPKD